MNRKGFTLIEVLAVIIIMGIVLVLAVPSLGNVYKNSKLKSEEIFVERLSQTIDSYVKLNTSELGFNKVDGTFEKKYIGSTGEAQIDNPEIYEGKISDQTGNRRVTFSDIISENLMSTEDYVNAGNKDVACNLDAEIEIYRDSDFVYCYKVKKESFGCLTSEYKATLKIPATETEDAIDNPYAIDTCIWEEVKND